MLGRPLYPEEAGRGPGGEDEVRELELELADLDGSCMQVNPLHLAQNHAHVLLSAKDRPHRIGDLIRLELRRSHLIQERGEGVEVAPVHEAHLCNATSQATRGKQTAEARPDE